MEKKEIQNLWDNNLVQAFYLKPEYKSMYKLIEQFAEYNKLPISELTNLELKRFPLNLHKHLSLSPITFICSYMPHLGKYLWEKADIKETIIDDLDNINCEFEKKAANLKYESGNSQKNKKALSDIGRAAIATNRMLDETKVKSLNWGKK